MKTFMRSLIVASLVVAINSYAEESLLGKDYEISNSTNHIVKLSNGKVVQDFKVNESLAELHNKSAEINTQVDVISKNSYSGQEAIDYLGEKINHIAVQQNVEIDYLKNQILNDATLRVDKEGNLLYVDEMPANTSQNDISNVVFFNGDATKLHSKPGAQKVIFLDTDGYDATNSVWGAGYNIPVFLPWATSQDKIYQMWTMVAEDYAPFDVDVTTEDPGWEALVRSSISDEYYGAHVVLTDTSTNGICANCGGIAYIATFSRVYPNPASQNYYQPALVFGLLGSPKNLAEAASHEAGHVLNLHHDGYDDGTRRYSYYCGTQQWAPIMGVGYYSYSTQWSKGEYFGANNKEDDLAIITAQIPYRTDIVADTKELATSFETDKYYLHNAVIKEVNGLIEASSDIDVYTFTSSGGVAKFTIMPKTINPSPENQYFIYQFSNLRPNVELYNDQDILVARASYFTTFNEQHTAIIDANLAPGKYYLKINGSGYECPYDPASPYFTSYASIGQYNINGYYPTLDEVDPPIANINSSNTSGVGPFPVDFDGTYSTIGYGGSIKYYWDFGDGTDSVSATPSHTFYTSGTTVVKLTVINDADLTSTTSIDVNVKAPLTNIVKVKKMTMKLTYNKKYNSTIATVTASLVNELKKGVSNLSVCGYFEGFGMNTKDYQACIPTNKSGNVVITSYGGVGKNGTMKFTLTHLSNTVMVFDKQSSVQTTVMLTK